MIGLSRSSFRYPVPDRNLSWREGLAARMTFSGRTRTGADQETRTITSLTVTNSGETSLGIEVESEATKESFAATIQSGATVAVPISPLQMHWNAGRRIPGWDGLNIRTWEPA